MIYITAYPLTQRINPMRKFLLTMAAAVGTLAGASGGQTCRTAAVGGKRWTGRQVRRAP